jgi:hypothetical protein
MFSQLFTDGTSLRTIEMESLIIGFMSDNGFKCITLSSSIFVESKSAEGSVKPILNTFKEGRGECRQEIVRGEGRGELCCSVTAVERMLCWVVQ